MLSAIASPATQPALLLIATFATGPVYIWSGMGPLVWNGNTYAGLGAMAGISVIDEGSTVEAKGIVLSLSGIDSTLLPLVLNESLLGAPVTIYLGFWNAGSLIADPVVAWRGLTDIDTFEADGMHATISINCENRLLEMNTSVERRITDADLQRDYPGDLAHSFVVSLQEMNLPWGTSPTTSSNI